MGLNGTVREGLHMKFDKVFRVKEYISGKILGYAVGAEEKSLFGKVTRWYEPDLEKMNYTVVGTSSIKNAKLYPEIDVALKQIDHGYRVEEIKIW